MSDQPLSHSAQRKIMSSISAVIESIANTKLGHFAADQLNNFLGIIESSLLWPGSSKHHTTGKAEQNGSIKPKTKQEVIRPLPWIFFIPLLLAIRVTKTALDISSKLLGHEPPDMQQILNFIRSKRRDLRAYKYRPARSPSLTQNFMKNEIIQVKEHAVSIISAILLAPANVVKKFITFAQRCTTRPETADDISEEIVVSSTSHCNQTRGQGHNHHASGACHSRKSNSVSKETACIEMFDHESELECSEAEDDQPSLETTNNSSRQTVVAIDEDYDSDTSSTLSLESATDEVSAEIHKECTTHATDEYYSPDGSAHGTPEPLEAQQSEEFIIAKQNCHSDSYSYDTSTEKSFSESTSSMYTANSTLTNSDSDHDDIKVTEKSHTEESPTSVSKQKDK